MLPYLPCLLSLTLSSSVAARSAVFNPQVAFQSSHGSYENYDIGVFSPLVDSLGALSANEFTTLTHPAFPKHSARIKKTEGFCDETVSSYTGYIDIEARHIFFYFFESRNDPATDDVIFWTNGGPGCSSALGLFMELGPCRVVNSTSTEYFEESWNTNANVFFVDQPIGVGFSYADYGESVSTTEEAAVDIAAFVSLFFENFPSFKGRAFHMAGESYGGRYVPVFASAVYDQNADLVAAGMTPINLTSVMIGNGLSDPYTLVPSYYDMTCTPASLDPVLPIGTCIRMKKAKSRCEKWLQDSCVTMFDEMNCAAAMDFCNTELSDPFESTGLNFYNMGQPCEGNIEETLCYPITVTISEYLNQPSLRRTLGIPSTNTTWSSCSNRVSTLFALSNDELHPSKDYVGALLERGIRTLIYVGDYDWICNWVANEAWVNELEWSGREGWKEAEMGEWKIAQGEGVAGKVKSSGGLSFVTVHQAGHMVPWDKPKEALYLVQKWLAGAEL